MNEEKKLGEIMQSAGPYMTLGLQMAAAVTVFLFIGKYADDRFGTKPWLMIVGIVFGFAGGMIKFFRTVIELGKQEEHERRNKE